MKTSQENFHGISVVTDLVFCPLLTPSFSSTLLCKTCQGHLWRNHPRKTTTTGKRKSLWLTCKKITERIKMMETSLTIVCHSLEEPSLSSSSILCPFADVTPLDVPLNSSCFLCHPWLHLRDAEMDVTKFLWPVKWPQQDLTFFFHDKESPWNTGQSCDSNKHDITLLPVQGLLHCNFLLDFWWRLFLLRDLK